MSENPDAYVRNHESMKQCWNYGMTTRKDRLATLSEAVDQPKIGIYDWWGHVMSQPKGERLMQFFAKTTRPRVKKDYAGVLTN